MLCGTGQRPAPSRGWVRPSCKEGFAKTGRLTYTLAPFSGLAVPRHSGRPPQSESLEHEHGICTLRLKGKHKADYSPHVDMGDHIVVVNAEQVKVTGAKLTDKIYYHHTGAIGGIKSIALEKLLKEHPERVLQFAIKGMLPKTILGRRMYRKLHVFAGDQHPHSAQQPKPLNI
ncbi:MAG: hypothetical protein RLY56_1686 [Pseudomonadota bacterium]